MVLSTKLTVNKVNELYNQKESQEDFIYLGKGGSGVVYRYGDHAIKIIPTEKFNQSEYELSRYFNKLLDENITINFLRTYNLYEFDRYKVIEMELASGDLYEWIEQKNGDKDWLTMILQLLITLRIVQQRINFVHRDLKPKNILFKKLDEDITFTYRLNDRNYTIQLNYIFYLTDFTHSRSDLITNNKTEYTNIDSDLYELQNLPKRLKVDKLMSKYNLNMIIDIGSKSKLSENFLSYLKSETDKTNKKLSKYNNTIKEKFIKRSLIYYLIENKILDIELDVIDDKISTILSELTNLDLDAKIDELYSLFF